MPWVDQFRRRPGFADRRQAGAVLGEATHGTHEFYRIRADLTRALLQHRGFTCVAAEADWPDAYRANRWVRLLSDEVDLPETYPTGV